MNRRELLRNGSYYLATTATICGTCGAALGSMFPGQGDEGVSNANSMFPGDERLDVDERSDPKVEDPATTGFQLDGCTFNGVFGNQFRFVPSSGDPRIDQATFEEANHLARVTGMQPSLAFLDDRKSKNAVAFRQDIISGRSPHGAVAMGVRLIEELLAMPTLDPSANPLCIQGVLVHEWAHIAQFNHGIQASRVKGMELMADFIAGWYLGYKDAFFGRQSDPTSPMLCMASVGDTNFNDPAHHGKPEERFGAYRDGFLFVKGGGGGGLGGGVQGGFFTGDGTYGGGGYGGGYGSHSQPPHFEAAFRRGAQKYIG